ncbi:MAG: hypothetical protein K9G58_14805 [Bacteroidales bacterium]|nr:hypothetical protein [Bacteroidales bacterium]MCF8387776.1 hypothetical protein [Bacteroidales bacterium]MCF8399440.1 hypothetical protein [Bacteroidales bacterium]
MIEDKIWYNLVNTKFKCYYIGYLIRKYQRQSISINSFLSVISLSSVSAWVIWEIIPWLWALLIALSNVLIAIKPFLTLDKKIKELNEKLSVLELIQAEYEKIFFEHFMKYIDDKVASKKYFDNYDKQIKTLRTSDELLIGRDRKLIRKADKDTDRYIENNYQTKTLSHEK